MLQARVQDKVVIRVHQVVSPAVAVIVAVTAVAINQGATVRQVIAEVIMVADTAEVSAVADTVEVSVVAEEAEVLAVEAEVDFMEAAVEADLVVEAVTGAVEAAANAVKKMFVSERNPVYRVPFFYVPACANFCKNN